MTTLLAIEGADACGKATQAELLQAELADRGFKTALVEIPRKNGVTYDLIYRMLRTGSALRYKRLFQGLQFMNKLLFETLELPDLRASGVDFVILDRWSLSSVIYGIASGVEESFVMATFNQLVEPDCTVILHGPAYPREGIDSYERNTKLQEDVRDLYRKWALDHPRKYQLIHTSGRERAEVADVILNALEIRGVVPTRASGMKGRVDLKYNPLAMDEEIYIPVRGTCAETCKCRRTQKK